MPTRKSNQLTLHEAMLDVLRHAARAITAREIAEAIERRDLYRRKDGRPATVGQIQARARKYPHLFKAEGKPLRYTRANPANSTKDSGTRTAAFSRYKQDILAVSNYFLAVNATVAGFDHMLEKLFSMNVSSGAMTVAEAQREFDTVKLQESARAYDSLVLELILCRAVDGFLVYVAELMALVYTARPETMKSAETLRLDLILENETMEELIAVLVDKRINDLAYKGMRELSRYLSDKLGLQLFGSQKDLERAADIIEVRNLVVHNRGIINRTFLKKVTNSYGALGEQVRIEEVPLFDDLWFLVASASLIDDAAVEKFGLPLGS